jgi:hypothetical protein
MMRRTSEYIVGYLLFAFNTVVAALVGWFGSRFVVAGLSILTAARAAGNERETFYAQFSLRATDVWSYLVVGTLLIIVYVFLEWWYRSGVQQGRLWTRFYSVTAIECGILLLLQGFYTVAAVMIGVATLRDFYMPIGEMLAVAVFVWLYVRQKRSANNSSRPHLMIV